MIAQLLQDLDNTLPASEARGESLPDAWESILSRFAPKLYELGSSILAATHPLFGKSLDSHSTVDFLVSRNNAISLAEYRLRPKTTYYTGLHKVVPAPENPTGPSATGLSLAVSLLRAFESRDGVVSSKILLELEIWGDTERAAFGECFQDYRRPITLLLANRQFSFFTSVPFANVDAHNGASVAQKIALYYKNEHDEENQFSISIELTSTDRLADAVRSIFPLAVLYHCAMGYCEPRKNKNRMLRLFPIVANIEA